MAKAKAAPVLYVCTECGYSSGRWFGKCPSCGTFGTLVEEQAEQPDATARAARPLLRLVDVEAEESQPHPDGRSGARSRPRRRPRAGVSRPRRGRARGREVDAPPDRLAVVAPSHAGRPTPTALRAALLADVLRRFQEHLHGVQVFVVFVTASGDRARLRGDLDALWIPPPTAVAASIEAASELLGGPLHLIIDTEQAPPGPPRLMVGPVNRSAGLVDGTDPLAVRLALLAVPYTVPTALDDDELDLVRHPARAVAPGHRRLGLPHLGADRERRRGLGRPCLLG